MEYSSTVMCQQAMDSGRLMATPLSMPSSGMTIYKMVKRAPLMRGERRTHFDSADYYMQREGKLSSDVLLPNNPSPQLASPLLERPTLLVTSRPSRLGCSR
ncbi:hypothetical protein OEZ86_004883 [Tetradesmus obliquus]|uniref:Uncharacterized protein n=1 Tax=Tetradesmus obliquus TaxID=3088 RepID=A0ABY8UKU3_TETOB|nr:hypothetical protein OEZ85_005327 [Tetradesmus obliquus]WIA41279.1 hypothetical protein OEZ86_004883 [Tetradesmus obliquus]